MFRMSQGFAPAFRTSASTDHPSVARSCGNKPLSAPGGSMVQTLLESKGQTRSVGIRMGRVGTRSQTSLLWRLPSRRDASCVVAFFGAVTVVSTQAERAGERQVLGEGGRRKWIM